MSLVAPVFVAVAPIAAAVIPVAAQNKAKCYGQRDTDKHLCRVVAHGHEKVCEKLHTSLFLMNKVQL